MKRLVPVLTLLVVVAAAAVLLFPMIVRWVVIAQVQALTNRHVSLDAATLSVREGRLIVRGLRLTERDGEQPFAAADVLDVRVNRGALLRGHVWIRELTLQNPTVRVVRLSSNEFNLSDLVRRSGTTTADRMPDVSVDRFALVGGTVTLEDRALPGGRTWTSERITIEARNVSTLHAHGTAVASSVTGGAPVAVNVKRLRLYPIDLEASVAVEGADLALARLYLRADAPVVLDRGRVNTSVDVVLHARDGLRLDAVARFADVAFTQPGQTHPVVLAPAMTVRLAGVSFHSDGVRLGQFELTGPLTLFDPRVTPAPRFDFPGLRVHVGNLTWPLSEPARIDARTGVPGGGHLVVDGTLQAAPAASNLRVRLTKLDLAPWARYLPPLARITGTAEADLRVNEPIAAGIPSRIRGSIAVNGLGVADARQKLVGAERIEASGLEVQWPRRVAIKRVLVNRPLAMVERDRAGRLPLRALLNGPTVSAAAPSGIGDGTSAPAPSGTSDGASAPAPPATDRASTPGVPPVAVEIGEIVVQEGAVAWRDEAVRPLAQLDLSRINATVKGVGWPLRGPLGIQVDLRPPRGGELRVVGQVGVGSPPTADVRLALKGGELAPFEAYLPPAARVSGRADLDVAVKFPGAVEESIDVRGQAALFRLDVRDKERTVMQVERATATGLDVQWPHRVSVRDLTLQQPWILLERDERGTLPLRALLPLTTGSPTINGQPNGFPSNNQAGGLQEATRQTKGDKVAVVVQQLTVTDGGARVVDRSVAPPFAVDLNRLALKADGLSTAGAQSARLEVTGQLVPDAAFALQGTVGPIGGPLRVDLQGEVREFAIPRTNPYLLRQVAWKAREGRLLATVRGRVHGDALDARSDIRLRRLTVERAGPDDQVQTRIGLPLGLIVSLMKNNQGDITVSFPVSGRLNDPRFDFREAIWKSARTVAINAITTPVSWIGRLQYTADSRIEKIQIDPIFFQDGTATLTPAGETHTMRLAGFLEQVPEVRLAFTPVVTSGDLARLSRNALETALGRAALAAKISPEEAAARLFAQRFPNRQPPGTAEAVLTALMETEPLPTDAAPGLGAKRMEVVRAKLKQAKVDTARLVENKTFEQRTATEGGGVRVDLVESDGAKPPNLLERLRRLGAGITGDHASR